MTEENMAVVSFDPCAFAQEIVRPAREVACRIGKGAEIALQALEKAIAEKLADISACETYEGREMLRRELPRVLKVRRENCLRAGGLEKDRKTLADETEDVVRATCAAAMAYL